VVEIIESAYIVAGAGILALVLVISLLARQSAYAPVTVRMGIKKR
jgi:hypothetical protein